MDGGRTTHSREKSRWRKKSRLEGCGTARQSTCDQGLGVEAGSLRSCKSIFKPKTDISEMVSRERNDQTRYMEPPEGAPKNVVVNYFLQLVGFQVVGADV